MPRITVSGSIDPLLSVVLDKGESIFAERNAMVSMDSTLALTGRAKGGLFSALSRKVLNDESFFQQKIEAVDGPGEVLLTPTLPGDVAVLQTGERQYMIADGAYLASTEDVELNAKTQGIGRALLGNSGGFFVIRTGGTGEVAVSGFGSMRAIDLDGSRSVYVDNGHLVAWDTELDYEPALNTAKQGFFGKIFHSQTSGEGIVLKFSAKGDFTSARATAADSSTGFFLRCPKKRWSKTNSRYLGVQLRILSDTEFSLHLPWHSKFSISTNSLRSNTAISPSFPPPNSCVAPAS